jgi:protein-L-isoaspartate(D-aspartate) O-methyltransferase
VPQKQKRLQKDEQSFGGDVGERAANVAGPVRQALEAQGLVFPRPFGRVEGGVYLQNDDLSAALRLARSLPAQANARRGHAVGQALEKGGPSHSLEQIRHWYAEELRFTARLSSAAVVHAFAAVPRERFVGLGPWWFRSPMNLGEYWSINDASPRHVYHDVLIALDQERGINNGQPSLWARLFDQLDIKAGEQVLHLGCGTGYYSAIAAELVGPGGQITAVEIDRTLAEKALAALAPWPQCTVSNADGAYTVVNPVDVIIASAGATQPLPSWLDALKPGGRLLLPMTTSADLAEAELSTAKIALSAAGGPGAMLLVIRQRDVEFSARFLCRAGFIHFQGARDPDADRRLAAALVRDWGASVKSLRRDNHAEDETCWVHDSGWCLSRRQTHEDIR